MHAANLIVIHTRAKSWRWPRRANARN